MDLRSHNRVPVAGGGEPWMTVEPERARDLALALPETAEAPHFHRLAFRTPRRIFATLDAAARDLNLMLIRTARPLLRAGAPCLRPCPGRLGGGRAQRDASWRPWTRPHSSRRFRRHTGWRSRFPEVGLEERRRFASSKTHHLYLTRLSEYSRPARAITADMPTMKRSRLASAEPAR
jgi:hypothetical protein